MHLLVVAAQRPTGEGSRQHLSYTRQILDSLVLGYRLPLKHLRKLYSELEDRGRGNKQQRINK